MYNMLGNIEAYRVRVQQQDFHSRGCWHQLIDISLDSLQDIHVCATLYTEEERTIM